MCKDKTNRDYVTKDECHRCANRYWRSKNGGQCMSCMNTETYSSVSKEECLRCPNKQWIQTDAETGLGKCTARCSSGKYYENGQCVSCATGAKTFSNSPYWTNGKIKILPYERFVKCDTSEEGDVLEQTGDYIRFKWDDWGIELYVKNQSDGIYYRTYE